MKIYLACPYTHLNPWVQEERFKAANQKTAEIMVQGHIVFSPISHSHPIHVQCENVQGNWEFWMKQDKSFIDWCDELWVLCVPGYDTSKGVKAEVEYAKSLGKKVKLC